MKKKCSGWIFKNHDYEVIEERVHGYHPPITYRKMICLRCKYWVDQITPLEQRLKDEEFEKKSRKERAKILWADRYNPNV